MVARLAGFLCLAFFLHGATALAEAKKPRLIDAYKAAESAPEPHRRLAKLLISTYDRVAKSSGFSARVLYSPDRQFNAFAVVGKDGTKYIAFYRPLLESFESDPDALAYVIGHELGHHHQGHTTSGRDTRAAISLLATIAGAVVDDRLERRGSRATGAGQIAGSVGGTLLIRKYTRDQEREADSTGLTLMTNAGFDPRGALRAQQAMRRKSGDRDFVLFDSHPSSSERIENLEAQIRDDPVMVAAMQRSSSRSTSLALSESASTQIPSSIPSPASTGAVLAIAPSSSTTPKSDPSTLWQMNEQLRNTLRDLLGATAQERAQVLKRLADAGDAEALAEYALALAAGRGMEMDRKEGCAQGKVAWDRGAKNAISVVVLCLVEGYGEGSGADDKQKAYALTIQAWEEDRVRAALITKAMLQERGFGTEKNAHAAAETLRHAASLGDANAASRLAILMGSGTVGPLNATAVEQLHREAALHGSPNSMVEHARLLLKAKGRSGLEEAYSWVSLADRMGLSRATQTKASLEDALRKAGLQPSPGAADVAAAQVRAARDAKLRVPW